MDEMDPDSSTYSYVTKDVNLIEIDRPLAIVYAAIGTCGVIGNSFVLLIIIKYCELRQTVTDFFIINQSIIDFMASIFIVTTSLIRDETLAPLGIQRELFCRLWLTNFPIWAMFVSSTCNLVAVSFERYLAIVHPLKFKWRVTKKKSYILITIVWLVGPAYNAAYMIPSSCVNDHGECSVFVIWPNELIHSMHGVLSVIIQFIIPLTALTATNYKIAITLQEQSKRCDGDNSASALQRRQRILKARNNMVKTLALLFACFVLCWVWNQVYYLLFNLRVSGIQLKGPFYHFSVIAVFCNSCINPAVYAVKYDKFQSAVLSLFCCRNQKGEADQPSPKTPSRGIICLGGRINHACPENNDPCPTFTAL